MDRNQQASSYNRTRNRFDKPTAAAKYAGRRKDGQRQSREERCILAALNGVPRDSAVLDLPCGTGRITSMLVKGGFEVVGADSSPHMVELAREGWLAACRETPLLEGKACFAVQDVMATSFADAQFAAVICNRLFHHFTEADTRRAALAELRRISAGPVVVFFFNSFALDSVRLHVARSLFGKFQRDRIPISKREFEADAASVGLKLEKIIHTSWGISPQCYAVLHSKEAVAQKPPRRFVHA